MSRLDDRSIGEFVGWLVHELGWLFGWLLDGSIGGWSVCETVGH